MPFHDFKYDALRKSKVSRGAAVNPRTEYLRKPARAFIENVFRTDSFTMIWEWISFRARRDQIWKDCATVKTTGKLDPDLLQSDDDKKWKIDAEIARLHKQFSKLPDIEKSKVQTRLGAEYIDFLLRTEHGMNQAMERLLSSIVIEAWIAFETLAPDLWIAAVDNGPEAFAQRLMLSNRIEKPDANIAQHWKGKLQYDPRKNFAASLVESGRVSFRKLDRIIQWYSITFEGDVHKLFKNTRKGYIHALSAYRNALVHSAGRVDKDFIKQVEPVDELRGVFKENQKLQLDGELVSKLRDAAIDLGNSLILFVDDLITPLKTP